MSAFNFIGLSEEYNGCNELKQSIMNDLHTIIVKANTPLEGNSFYVHQTLDLYDALYTKQINLFWSGKQAKTHICEIGFNAGHSTMLMLLGRDNSPVDFTVFDIGHHAYTKPCLDYIKTRFPHINFEYIEGDSTTTMPIWISEHPAQRAAYDVVHVDGGHSEHCISNDMKNADQLVNVGGLVIIDDTNCGHINKYVDLYIASGNYIEVDVLKTTGYPHRIIQRVK